MAWISNYIHVWNTINHSYLNFNGGLNKPSFNLVHRWMKISNVFFPGHIHSCMLYFIRDCQKEIKKVSIFSSQSIRRLSSFIIMTLSSCCNRKRQYNDIVCRFTSHITYHHTTHHLISHHMWHYFIALHIAPPHHTTSHITLHIASYYIPPTYHHTT